MRWHSRYLIILVFFLLVITAMFFIYRNIGTPERIVYFGEQPSWFEKIECVFRGGALEITQGYGSLEQVVTEDSAEDLQSIYQCHFH